MKQTKIPQAVQLAIVGAVLLLAAVVGYFVVVSPQHKKASDIAKQIDQIDQQIADARALLARAKNAQKVRYADLFRLTKAMPDEPDEAGILLELSNVAHESGISFQSIRPEPAVSLSGYQVVPIKLIFDGNFYRLSDFLFRVRNLVDVRRGALDAEGRLFTVDQVAFDQAPTGFPDVRVQLSIAAFIYGAGAQSAPPQATPASAGIRTSTATTTTSTASATSTAPASTPSTPTTTAPAAPVAPPPAAATGTAAPGGTR